MGESMKSLFQRGAISSKTMGKMSKPAILSKTKSGVPTKMAAFDGRQKDEGKAHGKGHSSYSTDEINESAVQDKGGTWGVGGKFAPPTKGGRAGKEGQVSTSQIDTASMQKPKFPPGGNVKGSHGKRTVGIKGHSGKSSGPQYGGPNSRANG